MARNDVRPGIGELPHVAAVLDVADGDDAEACAVLGAAQRLGGGHLHRLLLEHQLGLGVAGDRDADAADRSAPPGRAGSRRGTCQ